MNNQIDETLCKNTSLIDTLNICKHILSGLRTIEDCYLILDICKFNETEKEIILQLINQKKQDKYFDYITLKSIIKEMEDIEFRNDAQIYANSLLEKTDDIAQIRAIMRLVNNKPSKPQEYNYRNWGNQYESNNCVDQKIEKKCPHCGHTNKAAKSTGYIICGYGDNGYDWEGCGKDWCFRCNKILCKTWDSDMLFIEKNRIHDGECCKRHASIQNMKWPENYCHCTSTLKYNSTHK